MQTNAMQSNGDKDRSFGNVDDGISLAAVQRAAASFRASLSRPALRQLAKTCPDLVDAVTEAALQIHTPFKVAVSGEVSSGKSSFVNAFLGQDLALVDTKECTAVCSEFEYGKPDSLEKPIQVYYRNGRNDRETLEFRDRLKGAGVEALDLAEAIDKLVFPVLSESLHNMVLVDTPGLNSAVREHEVAARGSLGVVEDEIRKKQLSERNDFETRAMASSADAVLWLVSEDVLARAREHLSSFMKGSMAIDSEMSSIVHAFNVMVVLTKVDEKKTREDRLRLQDDVSRQLNALLPCEVRCYSVSAGAERLLQKMGKEGLERLRTILIQSYGDMSVESIEVRFKCNRYSEGLIDSGMTPEKLGIPKGAFIRVAMILLSSDSLESAWKELKDLSGYHTLRKAISDHFASKATALKGRVAIAKCQKVLHRMIQEGIERTRQRIQRRRREIADFTRYVSSHPDYRAPNAPDYAEHKIGEALRDWLSDHNPSDTSREAESELGMFQETFDRLQKHFSRIWIRIDGLSALEDVAEYDDEAISDEEKSELAKIFQSNPEWECPHNMPQERAIYWGRMAKSHKSGKHIRILADIAANIYREWCKEGE